MRDARLNVYSRQVFNTEAYMSRSENNIHVRLFLFSFVFYLLIFTPVFVKQVDEQSLDISVFF